MWAPEPHDVAWLGTEGEDYHMQIATRYVIRIAT